MNRDLERTSEAELSAREKFECSRNELELTKLQLEIAQLHRPFWKNNGFWQTAGAISVPIIGAILAWNSGWFDLKQLEIKNSKILLQSETIRLEAQKEVLTAETAKLEVTRSRVGSEVAQLQELRASKEQQIISATNQLQILARNQEEKERIIQTLNGQVSKLTQENEAARKLTFQLAAIQKERDELLNKTSELRSHLAISYEHSRNVILNSVRVMTATAEKTDVSKPLLGFNAAAAVWRQVYNTDYGTYALIEFTNVTKGIVDPKLEPPQQTPAP